MSRLTLTTRYIPEGATLVDCAGTDAAVYVYERAGKFIAIGYHGKANKCDFHYSYRTEAQRAEQIKGYLDGRKARARLMEEHKAILQAPHTLKVGDILKSSWGYDQTNIDYYQVTRVIGAHSVEIREIGAKTVSVDSGWTGSCQPTPDHFIGEPMIKRSHGSSVKIASYASAYKVDASDVGHWTSYA